MEYLDLRSCALDDTAALHLSNMMKNSTTLYTVLLGDNNMNDSSGMLISEAVRHNTKIKFVDLS